MAEKTEKLYDAISVWFCLISNFVIYDHRAEYRFTDL